MTATPRRPRKRAVRLAHFRPERVLAVSGRPALTLYNGPDRQIIVAALKLISDPKDPRSLAILQALDFLLTPYDSIAVELGGDRLSLINTEPPHAISANSPPDRQPLSAPGGRAFRRSRLKLLREKVDKYRRAKLAKQEELFRDLSFLAFDFIAHGRWLEAGRILQALGWKMTDATRSRLAAILSNRRVTPPQVIETIR